METAQNYPNIPQARNIQPQYQHEVTNEAQESEDDGLNLGSILATIRRRAIVVGLITTAATGAVLAWTLSEAPKYQGSFQLLVEPVASKSKMPGNLPAGAELLGMGGGGSLDYESQLAVLQSPKVMEPIIQQLKSKYPQIDYKKLFGGPGQKATLGMDRIKKTKVITVSYIDKDPQQIMFVLEKLSQGYLNYSRDDRKTDSRQGIQFIDEQLPQMRQRVDGLQAQLQQFRQQYNLIDPQVQGQQLAQQMVGLENQRVDIRTAIVQQQLLSENLQKRLSGQTADTALVSSALTQAPRYQQLLTQLKDIRTKIELEKRRFTVNSPQIQDLLNQEALLEPLIRQEAEKVLGQNLQQVPLQQLESVPFQDSIRLGLAQQLVDTSNQIEVLKVRSQAIDAALKRLNEEVKQFPVVIRQFTDLQRELGVATNTLNQLLAQRESLRVDAAKQDVPWELISEPKIPKDKDGKLVVASPQLPKRLAVGLFGGLLLGVGTALLLDRLNNVFHRPEDIKNATKLPMLGVIPISDQAKLVISEIVPVDKPKGSLSTYTSASPFMEAFRSLNANLRLLNAGSSIRSLVISSPAPGDGKSTISTNLALAAAAMGQKVLLVDADLRWPQIQAKLGLPASAGLSDLLATDITAESVIQKSATEENLFIITAGSHTNDPLRLLSSKKMLSLMSQWRTAYDLVIYDTPPLLGLADSSLLAGYTDGMLLVVGISHTDQDELKQALQGLQMAGTPVLGIVANQVKETVAVYSERVRYIADIQPTQKEEITTPL